jgi:hypothetical protein
MKYGAMNFPIKPLLKEIEEIGEMGFDYVELTMALEVFSRDREYLKISKEKIARIWEAL